MIDGEYDERGWQHCESCGEFLGYLYPRLLCAACQEREDQHQHQHRGTDADADADS